MRWNPTTRTILAGLAIGAAAVALLPGCTRKVEKDVEQQGFSLLRTQRDDYYRDRADLSPVSPESILVPVYDGPASSCSVRILPEDTLDLFAKWSGQSVSDLLRLNPDVQQHGLVPGEMFNLVLTPGGFARLNGARNGYLASARVRQDPTVLSRVRHVVKAGETVRDLLDRYVTRIDLLEKWNRGTVQLARLKAGQTVVVPIVADDRREQPVSPKPPVPPPAPVPPADSPKPLTAAPEPAAKPPVEAVPAKAAAPAKGAAAPAPKPASYTVQPGDTAWQIAARYKVTRKDFLAANPGLNPGSLRPGQKIKLPVAPR
ncbi:MAG: LysM peptidoglycan-binding domain-containing protein [Deltaproteobacteria bacterium]|nr:LysM peptidoglycan-binding domain-containing protein [Deltaproteobacteria bacterium]